MSHSGPNGSFIEDGHQLYLAPVYHDLALVLEIDSDTATDIGLDLSQSPIRLPGMADKHSGFQQAVDVAHRVLSGLWGHDMSRAVADVTALLGSRICHDLISPLGAISNGVELLAMSGAGSMPEIDLIAQSVEHANARIGFFRVAFGAATPDQTLGASEVQHILRELTRGGRMQVDWTPTEDAPRAEVKLAFLALNCLESAMPRGGSVSVSRDAARWRLTATADRMRIEPNLWEALSRPAASHGATAAEVQFLLAPLVAADLGRTLTAELSETGATVRF